MSRRGALVIEQLIALLLALIVLVTVLIIVTKGFGYLSEKVLSVFRLVLSWRPKGL